MLDGRLEIDNNRAERPFRPFVIGRKNWTFATLMKGARSSVIIYSRIETAKENDLNPFHYLTYVLEQLSWIDVNNPAAIENYCHDHPRYQTIVVFQKRIKTSI